VTGEARRDFWLVCLAVSVNIRRKLNGDTASILLLQGGLQPFRTVMDFPYAELIVFMETYLPEEDIFHKDPLRAA
jgi:hypothetical protein